MEDMSYTTTAPTMNGDKPLPKRVGVRTMIPATWLDHSIRVEYTDGDGKGRESTATLLDWCPAGLLISVSGAKTLLSWDRLVLCELVES